MFLRLTAIVPVNGESVSVPTTINSKNIVMISELYGSSRENHFPAKTAIFNGRNNVYVIEDKKSIEDMLRKEVVK